MVSRKLAIKKSTWNFGSVVETRLSSKRKGGVGGEPSVPPHGSSSLHEAVDLLVQSRSSSSFIVSSHILPSRDRLIEEKPWKSNWSRKQRRLYHRVMSGFEVARKEGDIVRVLNLNSSYESRDLNKHWSALVKRIRRKYGRFEYMAVKELTKSGLEHLHIVFRGSYIPQKWLSETWNELHGAPVVWIAKLYSWSYASHVAGYFIKDGIGRFWMSWRWVFRGFVGVWKRLVGRYGFKALAKWKIILRSPLEYTTFQAKLSEVFL